MALETMTFPSRLRLSHKRGDFESMRTVLNLNGNQRIANIQCSVIDPLTTKANGLPIDHRMAVSKSSGWEPREGMSGITNKSLDMDFFCGPVQPTQDHVFGQVESLRGFPKLDVSNDEDEGYTRKRRRLAAMPVVEKLVFTNFLGFLGWSRKCCVICILEKLKDPSGEAKRNPACIIVCMLRCCRMTNKSQPDTRLFSDFRFSIVFQTLFLGDQITQIPSPSTLCYPLHRESPTAPNICSKL